MLHKLLIDPVHKPPMALALHPVADLAQRGEELSQAVRDSPHGLTQEG